MVVQVVQLWTHEGKQWYSGTVVQWYSVQLFNCCIICGGLMCSVVRVVQSCSELFGVAESCSEDVQSCSEDVQSCSEDVQSCSELFRRCSKLFICVIVVKLWLLFQLLSCSIVQLLCCLIVQLFCCSIVYIGAYLLKR